MIQGGNAGGNSSKYPSIFSHFFTSKCCQNCKKTQKEKARKHLIFQAFPGFSGGEAGI